VPATLLLTSNVNSSFALPVLLLVLLMWLAALQATSNVNSVLALPVLLLVLLWLSTLQAMCQL
jgi:hypothetical protein